MLFELANDVGDGGSLLADSDINAEEVLALLLMMASTATAVLPV
jgi:hypothetical protein